MHFYHLFKGNFVGDQDFLGEQGFQLAFKELAECCDVVKHGNQVVKTAAETVENTEDVLLTEVELPNLTLEWSVPGFDVGLPDNIVFGKFSPFLDISTCTGPSV